MPGLVGIVIPNGDVGRSPREIVVRSSYAVITKANVQCIN